MFVKNAFERCILGTAIGDALGLPCEGLTPAKQQKYFGEITGHHLFCGRGMYSDDTEHTFMVAQALIQSGGDVALFQKSLARQMRLWILMLPGGVGLATLRACLKLSVGVSPERSGVFSAGNGPAMRAALLGVFAHEAQLAPEQLIALNQTSSRLTHTDPKAEYGALAIALAARFSLENETIKAAHFLDFFERDFPYHDEAAYELHVLLKECVATTEGGLSTSEFCASQGWKAASGYIYHTVPAALHSWLHHPDNYRAGVLEIIRCGGDTDSTAAIVGGLIALRDENIPPEWVQGLFEWPRGIGWMQKVSVRLSEVARTGQMQKPVSTFWPGVLLRNIFFLSVVLIHGFRRLWPF